MPLNVDKYLEREIEHKKDLAEIILRA